MLKSISWAVYLQVLMAATAVYYLIVLMLYFSSDIRLFVTGKLSRSFAPENQFPMADFSQAASDQADPYKGIVSNEEGARKYFDTGQSENMPTANFQQEENVERVKTDPISW